MKIRVKSRTKVDMVSQKLDEIISSVAISPKKKSIRIAEELCNTDKIGIVRMIRTEFGVLIESVSESFANMTGVPRSALEGKYLHHVTGGNREDDLAFCDIIDRDGAASKEQPFNGVVLQGFILKQEDGVYTELLMKK